MMHSSLEISAAIMGMSYGFNSGWSGTMDWIMTFHSVGNGTIIPTDEHSIIFQRGWWLNHQAEFIERGMSKTRHG